MIARETDAIPVCSAEAALGGNLVSQPSDNDGAPVENGRRYHLERSPSQGQCRPELPAKPSESVHVRAYSAANWFTQSGVAKKRRRIELKGLPSFLQWRFITLTINPEKFPDGPLSAFLAGREHMRRFMYSCREAGLWGAEKWCWKLEFQENGWPHWHLLVGRTQKFTEEQLHQLGVIWGLGRTNVEMVSQDDFLYSFKYAFKSVFQIEEDPDDFDNVAPVAPQWFLDYLGSEMVDVVWTDEDGVTHKERAEKPTSGTRVRFFQTSRGFYTTPAPPTKPAKPPMSCKVPRPVRVVAEKAERTLQVVARKSSGKYVASGLLVLTCAVGVLWTAAAWHAVNGGAVFLGINSAVVPLHVIQAKTENQWKLQEIKLQNRLTLKAAVRLQAQQVNWQTC